VVGGQSRALRGDDVGDSSHEAGDQIQLPLAIMAQCLSSNARLDLSRPNITLPLVKIRLSGELTYFAAFSSPASTRR